MPFLALILELLVPQAYNPSMCSLVLMLLNMQYLNMGSQGKHTPGSYSRSYLTLAEITLFKGRLPIPQGRMFLRTKCQFLVMVRKRQGSLRRCASIAPFSP